MAEDNDPHSGDAAPSGSSSRVAPLASPVVMGWRGLAHYRTCSRRRVFLKSPEERTSSELYLVEETVTDVKPIGDLPLSKRLEICKNLGYERLEANCQVYKQGEQGSIFYIVFTGLVKLSMYIKGVQDDAVTILHGGHWFGETGIELEHCIREGTCTTLERTELLTLSKYDYDAILKIEKTPELRQRVRFLESIVAFRDVSKQSLRRLANVLTSRTFSKNRVITFQGDDAVEMYFLKSGECRVIMEIRSDKSIPFLPRASSFLSQYWPTRHHRCKQEVVDRERDWWRPSLIARQSVRAPRLSRCLSVPLGLPSELPKALLRSPDVIHQLVTHKRSPHLGRRSRSGSSSRCPPSSPKRPSSAPGTLNIFSKKHGSIAGSEERPLSPWGCPRGSTEVQARSGTHERQRSASGQHCSFVGELPAAIASGSRGSKSRQGSGMVGEAVCGSARFKSPSIMHARLSAYHNGGGRRRTSIRQKFSLGKFFRDCNRKERAQKLSDMEFSEKDHRLWQMGILADGVMPAVIGDENKYYRRKFQKWARSVINREKKLLSYSVFAGTPVPSFTQGVATSAVLKLAKEGSDQKGDSNKKKSKPTNDEDSTILDIGGLHAGQYFGERGLLRETTRAASIVSVTVVDTLVLNKWDFHRHCDRDIIKTLSAHEYKNEEHIYKQYKRSRKWELFKKKVVEDVFAAKKNRLCIRVGPRPLRILPRKDLPPLELPTKEWTY